MMGTPLGKATPYRGIRPISTAVAVVAGKIGQGEIGAAAVSTSKGTLSAKALWHIQARLR